MLELTQIGNIPLRGISLETFPYEIDRRPISKPEATLTDGGVAFPHQQYASRINERDVDGNILRRGDIDPLALYDELQNLTGRPIHIVGVYNIKGCFGIDAVWLMTQGVISRVRGTPSEFGDIRLRLSISLKGAWRPLNRLLWEYVAYDRTALTAETTPSTPSVSLLQDYPTWTDYLAERFNVKTSYYWRYKPERTNLMYDPDYWDLVVNYVPNGFPNVGEHEAWSNSTSRVTVWQDSTMWNFRPHVVYAVKGMDTANDVTLEMTRPESLGGDEIITIDTTALDTLLTSETATGLQTTDILIMGDVGGRAFIIRGNVIVAYCTSVISSYYGEVMGVIHLNENIEYRFNYDFASVVEWSSIIQWRKMT